MFDKPHGHAARAIAMAHHDRGVRAHTTLTHAEKAPGLFKPEFVAETLAEGHRATSAAEYWFGIGAL